MTDSSLLAPLQAILLVGGQGTRLRPLTLFTPKPLLPTAGVPFLAHQLARASAFGVRRIVFATSYKASMFADAFGDGSAFGLEIEYVTEDTPLGTGGAIRNAARALTCPPDAPVLVLNGDILSGHDITAQVNMHLSGDAALTLHLTEVEDASAFGCVPTDEDGRVLAFLEKTPNPVTNRINAGCYVFRRSVLDSIPPDKVVSVERETFPTLIDSGDRVLGFADSTYWLDVGTPAAYVQGSCDLVRGILASPALPGSPGESLLLPGATVSPEAKVTGGSVIGSGATIGAGALIRASIIADEATIAPGVTIMNSVIGPRASIAQGTILRDTVIGATAIIGPNNELTSGARIWPGVVLPEAAIRFSSDA
ncbi:NDP-sugar synthase [Acrocarpospora macrocephala]|uniref:GDP-mannose pyrophosphorylase n=1 Tax=Acrocarpospora macrocephala TaxID=150177 RepID=A0A5M3X792_9ACTN|nr:NDP-sugar synthase [Acrocarpospora macrocephala]GES16546.1 GDP-mannose pyrophosphorylase [Acrocarpospora macrocephala]